MNLIKILTLVLTFSSPAFAWQLDARKTCDILKAANERKAAEIEAAGPYKELGATSKAFYTYLMKSAEFIRIQTTYVIAFKELHETSGLPSNEQEQLATMLENVIKEELDRTFSTQISTTFTQITFPNPNSRAYPNQCGLLLHQGEISFTCGIIFHPFVTSDFHQPFSISIEFSTGTITIVGPHSKEIARLRSVESLPTHCHQFYPEQH